LDGLKAEVDGIKFNGSRDYGSVRRSKVSSMA
jgi:hypothetical protein